MCKDGRTNIREIKNRAIHVVHIQHCEILSRTRFYNFYNPVSKHLVYHSIIPFHLHDDPLAHNGAIHLLMVPCASTSIGSYRENCNPVKQINLPVTRLERNWSKLTPIRPNLLGRHWKHCSSSLFLSFFLSLFLPLHLLSALQQGQLCEPLSALRVLPFGWVFFFVFFLLRSSEMEGPDLSHLRGS